MLMNRLFHYSEAGKGLQYVRKVALDLIKARREAGPSEKVFTLRTHVHQGNLKVISFVVVTTKIARSDITASCM